MLRRSTRTRVGNKEEKTRKKIMFLIFVTLTSKAIHDFSNGPKNGKIESLNTSVTLECLSHVS